MNKQLTSDEQEFIQTLTTALPPVIARKEVSHFLGGIVSPHTVKNADIAGTGPEVAWRVGRKVAYKTESLLLWIVGLPGGISRLQNLKTL